MTEIVQLNLLYERWELKGWQENPDGLPGWTLVNNFVRTIIKLHLPYHGWILEWNPKSKYYTNVLELDIKVRNEEFVLDSLFSAMCKDAISFIKVQRSAPFEMLWTDYSKVSEGVITNNQKSEVFYGQVEAGDWFTVEKEEVVLGINHDGDPIFFLTLSSEGK